MPKKDRLADDKRFHRMLFGSLEGYDEKKPPCLVYVENGNAIAGYDTLALNYKIAADYLIQEKERNQLANWTAPVAFMVRQTLELAVKSVFEWTIEPADEKGARLLFSHNLKGLWDESCGFLRTKPLPIDEDARIDSANWIITNFHEVDSSGDLFRFASSRVTAFGRQKTYDRAGIYPKVLVPYFEEAFQFCMHWGAVLMNDAFRKAGHEITPAFAVMDFPRKKPAD